MYGTHMHYRKGVLTATIGDCETQTKLWFPV